MDVIGAYVEFADKGLDGLVNRYIGIRNKCSVFVNIDWAGRGTEIDNLRYRLLALGQVLSQELRHICDRAIRVVAIPFALI